MSATSSVGPYADEDELNRLTEIACDTFVVPPERGRAYFELAGWQNVRVVRVDGCVAGGLVVLPKGQWFGGRSIPMGGIGAVAIAPEFRARGAATQLLKATLAELHQAQTPLSTLFPATLALYRRVGYEVAGLACDLTMPTKSIDLRDRSLAIRPATPDDDERIRAVYTQWASRTAGNLDRIEFNWARVRKHRSEPTQGYVVCRGESIEGYAFVLSQPSGEHNHCLRVHDMAALTPDAVRRLLTFFADHRTMRDQVVWRSGPTDPMLMHLGEAPYTVTNWMTWMLRLVHVRRALEARGYPVGVAAEIHFDVHDDVLPSNSGRCVLHVADGRGTVQPGGRGAIDVEVRGLSSLYTGYLSPQDVVLAKLATGPAADLASAAAVFAGPVPWMRDEF